jgi:hypothetical protein
MGKRIIFAIISIFYFQVCYGENVFVYLLKYTTLSGREAVVYCGITNKPEVRVLEHVRDGTVNYNTFDTMVVFDGPISREEAYKKETSCIRSYDIPRLYQLYPRDEKAIAEYESHYDTSRLIQIQNPRVEYTARVRRALEEQHYQKQSVVCEDCGRAVTDNVINYSRNFFQGHIFCRDCQSYHLENPREKQHYQRQSVVCEDCGRAVTDNVINYSRNFFQGHIFCRDCQSYH